MLRLFTGLFFIHLLVACSTVMLKPDMDKVKDQPIAFQEGYKDGCISGYVAGGSLVHFFKKDIKRASKDKVYNNGWKQAYRDCKSEFRKMCRSDAFVSKGDLYCSDVKQQGLDKVEEK